MLRKQLEHSRGEAKLSTTSCVFPLTSFLFDPLPACFPTEQSAVNASLFVNFEGISYLYVVELLIGSVKRPELKRVVFVS